MSINDTVSALLASETALSGQQPGSEQSAAAALLYAAAYAGNGDERTP